MEMVLTGRNLSAQEAEKWGLVSRVVGEGEGEVVKEAVKVAKTIAGKGGVAVQAGKEAVNAGEFKCRTSRVQRVLKTPLYSVRTYFKRGLAA